MKWNENEEKFYYDHHHLYGFFEDKKCKELKYKIKYKMNKKNILKHFNYVLFNIK